MLSHRIMCHNPFSKSSTHGAKYENVINNYIISCWRFREINLIFFPRFQSSQTSAQSQLVYVSINGSFVLFRLFSAFLVMQLSILCWHFLHFFFCCWSEEKPQTERALKINSMKQPIRPFQAAPTKSEVKTQILVESRSIKNIRQ